MPTLFTVSLTYLLLKKRGATVLTHGTGPYVFDVHGQKFLDANSGLWNMVAGFDHKGLAQAAKDQYDRFSRLSRVLW